MLLAMGIGKERLDRFYKGDYSSFPESLSIKDKPLVSF